MARAAYPGDLLEHLRSFAVLADRIERAESGAYARAAHELAVGVSVLRRRIQTLAAWIGASLVEGRGPSSKITPAGARARELAARAIDAVEALAGSGDPTVEIGPLRVAGTATFLGESSRQCSPPWRARHRELRFRVRREGASSARDVLANGERDFAIVRSPEPPADLPSRRLPSATMRRILETLRPPRRRVMDRGRRQHGRAPLRRGGARHRVRLAARRAGADATEGLGPQRHRAFRARRVPSLWPGSAELEGCRRTFVDELVAACT